MQNVSVYRQIQDGKIVRVAFFPHIHDLFTKLRWDRATDFSMFGNSPYVRIPGGETFGWDNRRRMIRSADHTYCVDSFYAVYAYAVYAYVVYDEFDRLVTTDRLVGLYRAYARAINERYWQRIRRMSHPGRKRHYHRGCYHRLVRTMQERREYEAWKGEEFAPKIRASRSPRYLPTSWDDIARTLTKSWKAHRRHQWKDK